MRSFRSRPNTAQTTILERNQHYGFRDVDAVEGDVSARTELRSATYFAPLSYAQEAQWVRHQLAPRSPESILSRAFHIVGDLHLATLDESIRMLVDRHDILRTTIVLIDGKPMQSIARSIEIPVSFVDVIDRHVDLASPIVQDIIEAEIAEPIDLERGPLLRIKIVLVAPKQYVVLFSIHRVIMDAAGMDSFIRELSLLYASGSEGAVHEQRLPEVLQYADFAYEQHRNWESDAGRQRLAKRCEALRESSLHIELPTEASGDARISSARCSRAHELDERTLREIRDLAARNLTTSTSIIAAAFILCVARYSGRHELVIGSECRPSKVLLSPVLLGPSSTVVPLYVKLEHEHSFAECTRQVQACLDEAELYRDLPIELLSATMGGNQLHATRAAGKIGFRVNAPQEPSLSCPDATVGPYSLRGAPENFDLCLEVQEDASSLAIALRYDAAFYAAEMVDRMLEHCMHLLQAGVRTPTTTIEMLPLLHSYEIHQQVVSWNATARSYPENSTLAGCFESQADRTPDAVAVAHGALCIRYAELDERANQIAHYLRAFNVTHGDAVAICMERSLNTVAATLGVIKAGAAYVPLDPDYPLQRRRYMLSISGAKVLITESARRSTCELEYPDVQIVVLDDAALAASPRSRLPMVGTSMDLAYMMFTSGSTGQPKGVRIMQRGVLRLVCNTDYCRIGVGAVLGQVSNYSFDAYTFELWGALLNGARLEIIDKDTILSAHQLAQSLRQLRVDILLLTAALFHHISRWQPHAFAGLRYLLVGGEALDAAAVRVVLASGAPRYLLNVYGPTEATTLACVHEIDVPPFDAVPIGRPIANTAVYILDEFLRCVPVGVAGQLFIAGPGLAAGYCGAPELTERAFVPNPFALASGERMYATGDRARYRADGVIEFLGRRDKQVKIRGFRIELSEIEHAFKSEPHCSGVHVLARTDANRATMLLAYVLDLAQPRRDGAFWRNYLAGHLPAYAIPQAIIPLDVFPMTPNGKIDVAALPLPDDPAEQSNTTTITNPLHHMLIKIWIETLGIASCTIHDDFFALGGNSLAAATMVAAVGAQCGRHVALAHFFAEPTIVSLAQLLLSERNVEKQEPIVALRQTGSQSPFFYLNGDFNGGGFYSYALVRHLDADRPVYTINAHGTTALAFPQDIEEMASEFVALIKQIQPHGPYFLGGFCAAGNVAFEIARQLQASHEVVEKLILIDPPGVNGRASWLLEMLVPFQRMLGLSPRTRREWRAALGKFMWGTQRLRRALRRPKQIVRKLLAITRTLGRARYATPHSAPMPKPDIEADWRTLTTRYVPGYYHGAVDVLVAVGIDHVQDEVSIKGWQAVCDQLSVKMIDGEHLTCITKYVASTARHIQDCLSS